MRGLRYLLLFTDIGLLLYWTATLAHLVPPTWLYRDYADPTMTAWNLSFLPLDLAAPITGILALALARRCSGSSRALLVVSLAATSISGLQAVSFWTLRGDFDIGWWAPNLFLLAWPLPYLATLVWNAPAPRTMAA